MKRKPKRIGYISQIYPFLTETFVYREVLGLKRLGIDVATFAIWRPDRSKLSLEARELVESTFYVFPIRRLRFLMSHLFYVFTHPMKYLGTLLFVLTRRKQNTQSRLRTFYHFCEAVYLSPEIKRQRIQHLHAHFSINAATVAFVIARLLDISFSFTAHANLFTDQLILKEKIREARSVVVISEFNRRFIASLMSGEDHNHKIHTVHCGIPVDQFSPPEEKPENKVPVVLFVSQLAERKGARYLIEACRILADRGYDFRCILVGDGPESSLLNKLILKLHLEDVIDLKGSVLQEQLLTLLHQADLFVLPCVVAANGDIDGIPVVLMEAMATELPVVSTNISGIPELIRDGETGLLVREKDSLALAKALEQLLTDDEMRIQMGKNGRQQIIQEFNIERNVAKLATILSLYEN